MTTKPPRLTSLSNGEVKLNEYRFRSLGMPDRLREPMPAGGIHFTIAPLLGYDLWVSGNDLSKAWVG